VRIIESHFKGKSRVLKKIGNNAIERQLNNVYKKGQHCLLLHEISQNPCLVSYGWNIIVVYWCISSNGKWIVHFIIRQKERLVFNHIRYPNRVGRWRKNDWKKTVFSIDDCCPYASRAKSVLFNVDNHKQFLFEEQIFNTFRKNVDFSFFTVASLILMKF